MEYKGTFLFSFSVRSSGLAAISSASVMPYRRLMLNMVSFAFHFMHVPAIGFQWGGSGDRLGSLCSFHLVHNYLLAVRHFGGNYDNLSDTEILRAQPGICLADALCGYSIALCQLVQGFTRLDGMEHLLFRSAVLCGIFNVSPVLIFWSLPGFILTMSPVVTLYMLAME